MVKRLPLAVLMSALMLSPAFMHSESAEAHPLHTSLAELVVDQKTGTVQLSLRVFVDDFTKASIAFQQKNNIGRPASSAGQPSPLIVYAASGFQLTDSRSRRVALTSCGGKRVGDLMWLCFRGQMLPGSEGFRVSSNVMFDTFRDQINIVQASYGTKKVNLLFTPGEGPKPVS
jgi:hypothetical protein